MKIIITEEQKKKLFIPRRIREDDPNNKFLLWNKEQIEIDGIQINQYDMEGLKQGYWEEYDGDNMEKGNYVDGKEEGIWEYYYSNGNLMSKGSYKGGKADGIWEYYFRNGNLRFKQLYKLVKELPLTESETPKNKLFIPRRISGENSRWMEWNKDQPMVDGVQINQYTHDGKKEGYWEFYYSNGNLSFKGLYKNDLRYGIWEYYNINGQLSMKGSYKDDLKDGIWEWYYSNGNLMYKGPYKNGERDGIWEDYNIIGNLKEKRLYDNGKLVEKLPLTESETPKKKLFVPRRLSGEDSRWFEWNKMQPEIDGVKINQYTHDGKKNGIWEEYDEYDGSIQKGPYKNGLKQGYWEFYDENGQLYKKGLYKNDKKDGIWEKYDENGQLHKKVSYKNDGNLIETELYENGQLFYKFSYNNDKADGIWEFYNKNGSLREKRLYDNGKLVKQLPLKESETPKKKLFIPRRLSGENSRWLDWNKDQPIVNGKPINQYDMDGLKQGYWEEYEEDDNSIQKGSYKDGKEDGYWEYYGENGNLTSKGLYKDGGLEGEWKFYNDAGVLDIISNYKNGKLNGVTEAYYSNGNLERRITFKYGIKDGVWEFYDYNGDLIKTKIYKNNNLIEKNENNDN